MRTPCVCSTRVGLLGTWKCCRRSDCWSSRVASAGDGRETAASCTFPAGRAAALSPCIVARGISRKSSAVCTHRVDHGAVSLKVVPDPLHRLPSRARIAQALGRPDELSVERQSLCTVHELVGVVHQLGSLAAMWRGNNARSREEVPACRRSERSVRLR
jgi:hypothetical protein